MKNKNDMLARLYLIQEALQKTNVHSWLFYNVFHRDSIADDILFVPKNNMNTRPWFFIVPNIGPPLKIVHSIEISSLQHLPAQQQVYSSRKELLSILTNCLAKTPSVAINYSSTIPALSLVDYGLVTLLHGLQQKIISAASLIQLVIGILNNDGIASHEYSSQILHMIVKETWSWVKSILHNNKPLYEGEIRDRILSKIKDANLVSEESPIVAVGLNSSDPHYQPAGKGSLIEQEQVLQFDLWGKKNNEDAIFADISWVAYTGIKPPGKVLDVFHAVKSAREGTINFIRENLKNTMNITGSQVDTHTRKIFSEINLLKFVKHRTGHAIDTRLHGIGVNLDSQEFPDDRLLLNGSCFSVEPGLYTNQFGIRSEINAYIYQNQLKVSGSERQETMLTL